MWNRILLRGSKSRPEDAKDCLLTLGECFWKSGEQSRERYTTVSIKLTASPVSSIRIVSSSVKSSLKRKLEREKYTAI